MSLPINPIDFAVAAGRNMTQGDHQAQAAVEKAGAGLQQAGAVAADVAAVGAACAAVGGCGKGGRGI